MADIHHHFNHTLGLPKARELAIRWMDGATQQMGLECQHAQGESEDTITFERMGVKGTMKVSGTEFDVSVKLGMMMAAFKPMIEAEISKNLGRIIEKAQGGTSA